MSVTLENVTRLVDGIPTIRDVSLTLEKGTLSVLLGPTLSGKTSIMRLLAGLDKPSSGRVLADGQDVTGFDVRKRSVAMVYQQFINYPSFSVYENIASPLRVQGKPRAEIEKRVAEAAKLLRLEPYLERTPLQLSGGQQQRTALGGRTICMWEGKILQAGETPKVYRHPDTIRVAQVFSDPPLNLVRAEKRDGVIQYATGVVAPASGLYAELNNGEYRVGFRAHQLELANGQPGRHVFPATVTVTEITGSESFVHMTREDLNWVAVLHGVHEFEPGHALDAVLDPDNIFVFETATGRLVASPTNKIT